ncbi:MAG: hypothetical protein IJN16_01980 [Lachnospiraceae bacterium]|nr:hypothetical protein [Lachnospiraceae bacterium]
MSSKTKIVVLHMKELIYTGIFVVLGILLLIFLILLFVPGADGKDTTLPDTSPAPTEGTSAPLDSTVSSTSLYIPGIYNTELVLNDQIINVEVIVDRSQITSIKLVNLSEAVATMYPLLQPTFEYLTNQICENQSLENVSYSQESKYTSLVLLEAIRKALEKATP